MELIAFIASCVQVGLVEYKALGGTCVNVGCVPKKVRAYIRNKGNMDAST